MQAGRLWDSPRAKKSWLKAQLQSEEKHRAILETKQAPWKCWIADSQGAKPRIFFPAGPNAKAEDSGEVGEWPEKREVSKPENGHPTQTPALSHLASVGEGTLNFTHLQGHAVLAGAPVRGPMAVLVSPTLPGPGCKAQLPSEVR